MIIPPPPSPCSEDVIRGLVERLRSRAFSLTSRPNNQSAILDSNTASAIVAMYDAAQALTALVEERERASQTSPVGDGALPIPSQVWVVLGASGQYSDWRQWSVCVCDTEQRAKDQVGKLTSAMRAHWAAKPTWDEAEAAEDWDVWYERCGAQLEAWEAAIGAIDPGADEHDETNYRCEEVPFVAGVVGVAGRGDVMTPSKTSPIGARPDDHLYLECSCGSPDHIVRFYRTNDPEWDDVGVNVQMSPYLPWWRRAWVAAKYVFGDNARCHWGDGLISEADRPRVAAFVTRSQDGTADPVGKVPGDPQ